MTGEDEPASPVCYLSEAEDSYMGYADKTELAAALNQLLEAERAGVRVARATRSGAGKALDAFMIDLEKDEAHWCGVLKASVESLGETASEASGGFFDKAMAIDDPLERLAFLNRGQAWVVRKLHALMPRVRDDGLHAALKRMSENHAENIAATERLIAALRA